MPVVRMSAPREAGKRLIWMSIFALSVLICALNVAPSAATAQAKGAQEKPTPSLTSSEIEPYSKHPSGTRPYFVCPPPTKTRVSCGAIGVPPGAMDVVRRARKAAGYGTEDGTTVALEGSGKLNGFSPADLQSAYKLPAEGGEGQTVAIVLGYDYPTAESDLAVYREEYKLSPCTTANGCFKKVNYKGEEGNYPEPNSATAMEASLDLDMVSATCPECHLIFLEAQNIEPKNLYPMVEEAAKLGATVISNSWVVSAEQTHADHYFNQPGIPVLFASGDFGYVPGGGVYPATSPYVIAVGGASLKKAENSRGWSETAWSGAGSTCSAAESKPAWQKDEDCPRRTITDVSAVADPDTPVSAYDSYKSSGWRRSGGTSAATPLVAGIEALSSSDFRAAGPSAFPRAEQGGQLFDPIEGANGFCAGYLCNAETGYDGPTGWGTPLGPQSLPVAATETASATSTSTATLRGAVRPGGVETKYHFEYGETTAYGTSVPVPDKSAGSGSEYVEVSEPISGLKDQRAYHYRLTATNSKGTFHGVDRTFGTTPPSVTTSSAGEVHIYRATLNGTVNPEGLSTSYYFEYGGTTSYGNKLPLKAKEVGAGTTGVAVSTAIEDLDANATYHYRLVAKSPAGKSYGADKTFMTAPAQWWARPLYGPGSSSTPTGNGVSCPQLTMCIAVGSHWRYEPYPNATKVTLATSFDGAKWSPMESANPPGLEEGYKFGRYAELRGVSCTSTTACTAVGSFKGTSEVVEPLADRWNGTQWELQSVPMPSGATKAELKGVSCTSTSACEAVGTYTNSSGVQRTLAERWNGTQWEVQSTPNPTSSTKDELRGVSCTSATQCMAVGSFTNSSGIERTLAEGWNGSTWTEKGSSNPTSESAANLSAVSCSSGTACTAVGRYVLNSHDVALVEVWNGSAWAEQSIPTLEDSSLSGISCDSTGNCTAAGSYKNPPRSEPFPLIVRRSGSTWSVLETATLEVPVEWEQKNELNAISCAEALTCSAVGRQASKTRGAFLFSSSDGLAEQTQKGPSAATEAATSIRQDEATLNGTVSGNGAPGQYYFEYGPTSSYGNKITAYVKEPKEKGEEDTLGEVKMIGSITGLTPNTTYHFRLVGSNEFGTSQGVDKTFTTLPAKWTLQSTPNPSSNASLKDVSCIEFSTSMCIAVGSNGAGSLALRWNGSEWSTMTSPGEGGLLTDVSCGTVTSCLALPSSGLNVQRWNGSEWTTVTAATPPEATSSTLYGVSCRSSTFCIAVGTYLISGGSRTLAEKWNGSAWTILSTPNEEKAVANYLHAVSCTSSTSCTAFGMTIGTGKATALRWNGAEWSALAAPNGTSTANADIFCTEPNACTAVVGNSAKVERWNGSEWTSATVPTPEGGSAPSLYGISCATSTSCVAVGSYSKESKTVTLAEKWNGSEWSVQSTPNLEGGGMLRGVSCISPGKCTAVGYYSPKEGESKTIAARYGIPPTATTEAATSVKTTEATLNATVNPEGSATSYWFEYGTTTSYGTKIPTTAKEVGSGTSNVAVSQTPSGLEPNTTYHFRLVAEGVGGTTKGEDKTFTTLKLPKATTEAASSVKTFVATLNATVNPEGTATSYWFEYGTTTAYGTKIPTTAKEIGSGTSNVAVSQTPSGLIPQTTYHFRVVAESTAGKVNGADKEFTTVAPPFSSAFGSTGSGNGQFTGPRYIALDSEGNLWVTDYGNNRVQKFNSKGEYLTQFGSKGTGKGQFEGPNGITVDSEGNIWVVDTGNNRVQKFNSKGEWLLEFGSKGSGDGQFNSPQDIAFFSGTKSIWVVDDGNHRVQKFNTQGEFLMKFGSFGEGEGQLYSTKGIAIDSEGNVWVTDMTAAIPRVQKFNSKGEFLMKFGSIGNGNGQFLLGPPDVTIDTWGNLWVSDRANNRVQVFNSKGEYLTKFGSSGSGEGQFSTPYGIAVDASGNAWVVDNGHNRVERWGY